MDFKQSIQIVKKGVLEIYKELEGIHKVKP